MGPKKNKKKNDDDDELFNKKEKQVEEILSKVRSSKNKKQNSFEAFEEDEDINFKQKEAFDWDLSQ